MQEIKRLQVIKDLSEWVLFHEEQGPMPEKPFTHSLLDVAVALETQLILNDQIIRNRKEKQMYKVVPVPNQAMCVGVVLAAMMSGKVPSEVMKSFACANGNYVMLVRKEDEASKFQYNPDQLDLEKEAKKEERASAKIILLGGQEG